MTEVHVISGRFRVMFGLLKELGPWRWTIRITDGFVASINCFFNPPKLFVQSSGHKHLPLIDIRCHWSISPHFHGDTQSMDCFKGKSMVETMFFTCNYRGAWFQIPII